MKTISKNTTTTTYNLLQAFSVTLTLAIASMVFVSCGEKKAEETKEDAYLLSFEDPQTNQIGYKNSAGEIVIPAGKYPMCFTDTFYTYAIVALETGDLVGIDRSEKVLYEVFNYDNGPDYPAHGLFRIIKGDKIGFADEKTGKIVIEPMYDCADPFTQIDYLEGLEGQILSGVSTDCGDWAIQEDDGHVYYNEALKKLNIVYINTKGEVVAKESEFEDVVEETPQEYKSKEAEMKAAPKSSGTPKYLGIGQYTKSSKSKCGGDAGTIQYFKWADGRKAGDWVTVDACFSESKSGTPQQAKDISVYGYTSQNMFYVTSWQYDYNSNMEQRPVHVVTPNF